VSLVTIDGAGVLEAAIVVPRIGVPTFQASLLERDAPAGPSISVALGSQTWKASVTRAGAHAGRYVLNAVGGAGGMSTLLAPKAYQGVPVRIPLEDIVKGAGEALAASSSPALLGTYLGNWIRIEQGAGFALAALLARIGRPAWRVLADGSLWVGSETWPATKLARWTVTGEGPHRGILDLVSTDPVVLPGETLEGRKVSVVEHRVTARGPRTRLSLEDT
jgi:hypothetical protein